MIRNIIPVTFSIINIMSIITISPKPTRSFYVSIRTYRISVWIRYI